MHHMLLYTRNFGTHLLISLPVVALGYALAQRVEVSGPIAMVVIGLAVGNLTLPRIADDMRELFEMLRNGMAMLLAGAAGCCSASTRAQTGPRSTRRRRSSTRPATSSSTWASRQRWSRPHVAMPRPASSRGLRRRRRRGQTGERRKQKTTSIAPTVWSREMCLDVANPGGLASRSRANPAGDALRGAPRAPFATHGLRVRVAAGVGREALPGCAVGANGHVDDDVGLGVLGADDVDISVGLRVECLAASGDGGVADVRGGADIRDRRGRLLRDGLRRLGTRCAGGQSERRQGDDGEIECLSRSSRSLSGLGSGVSSESALP